MRFTVVAAAVALAVASAVSAQTVSIPGIFNTGVDAAGNPLAPGSFEQHYDIVGVPTERVVNGGGLGCRLASTWYVPTASCWIWEGADGQPTNVTRIFRLILDLTGLDPTTAQVTGEWGTDNFGDNIFINGVGTGQTSGGFGAPTPFSVTSGFVSGLNKLDFTVRDVGVVSGFDVQHLTGTARLLTSAVPEPGTYGLMATGLLMLAALRFRRR